MRGRRTMNNKMSLVPPPNEIIWTQYLHNEIPIYAITSTKIRDYYYLYEVKDNKLIKTKYKNKDPTELEKYMKLGVKE